MKTNRIICLLGGIWLASCSPNDPAPYDDVPTLHQKFHGKYNVISSVSSEAIDVNLDGKVSTDMTKEILQLAPKYGQQLEIRIYGPNKNNSKRAFYFMQYWPEQEIFISTNKTQRWEGEPIEYQPGLIVNYLSNALTRTFSFSPDLGQLLVQPSPAENAFRWILPQSVTVDKNTDTIQVVNKRRFYTSAGVKEVVTTTVYKRYTMVT